MACLWEFADSMGRFYKMMIQTSKDVMNVFFSSSCFVVLYEFQIILFYGGSNEIIPASILRKTTSGRHRPVSYPDGPKTARYRFT